MKHFWLYARFNILQLRLANTYSRSQNWTPHRKSGPKFTEIGLDLLPPVPLSVLNFIAVCKTVYEKSINFCNLQYFSAPRGPYANLHQLDSEWCTTTNLFITLPNFVPTENHSTRYRQPKFVDSLTLWPTKTQTNKTNSKRYIPCITMRRLRTRSNSCKKPPTQPIGWERLLLSLPSTESSLRAKVTCCTNHQPQLGRHSITRLLTRPALGCNPRQTGCLSSRTDTTYTKGGRLLPLPEAVEDVSLWAECYTQLYVPHVDRNSVGDYE